MQKKINIGFDIGVASVGWSIIDDDYNIIDMGVRLFSDPANANDGKLANQDRRNARQQRRRTRRIKTRKDAFRDFIINKKWVKDENEFYQLINIDITKYNVDNPIELKVKAINEKISREELIFILFHYIHHRGFFYLSDEEKKILKKDEKENKESLEIDKNLFPSQQLLEFYKKNYYYKNSPIAQELSATQYEKEIIAILKKQELKQQFIDEYLEIFKRIRDFATGPGSEKSPTPYGIYQLKNNELIKYKNLWEKTIGKCTIYDDEFRGSKNSPISEVFNLLNDLNNLYLFNDQNQKLNAEDKKQLFDLICQGKKIELKNIIKIINQRKEFKENQKEITENDISGYRLTEKGKPNFTALNNYKVILKWLIENKLIDEALTKSLNIKLLLTLNDVFKVVAKQNKLEETIVNFKTIFNHLNDETIIELIKKIKGINGTHSLSYKAMIEYIEFCLNHPDEAINQMIFFYDKLSSKQNDKLHNKMYFPKGLYNDEIISPTTRKAFNQAINVINKIIKLYVTKKGFAINNITIELARDKNTLEEKKTIEKINENNKNMFEKIQADNNLTGKINTEAKRRLKLWEEQDHVDLYDGNPIDVEDVINAKGLQIDHIIPLSISGDDSMTNKVLTKAYLNKEKGNQTPYQWLSKKGQYEAFEQRVKNIIKNKNKINNLLYMLDPLEHMNNFIGRNLVDTRYASKILLNTFQEFFKNNEHHQDTKIKVINGSLTNFARYYLLTDNQNHPILFKNRDLYCHHAIDASIVCFLGMDFKIKQLTDYWNSNSKMNNKLKRDKESMRLINQETGEVIDLTENFEKNELVKNFALKLSEWNDIYDPETKKICGNNWVKFSHQQVNMKNRQLSNETIYSFLWDDDKKQSGRIIDKINLIGKDAEKLKDLDKYFKDKINDEPENTNASNKKAKNKEKNKYEKLLIYRNDNKLFNKLKTIYNQFYDKKTNPFVNYMKETYNIHDPQFILINNQRIKSLRVYGDKKEIDNIIIVKYDNKNVNKKVKKHEFAGIKQSLNWIEIRIYKNQKNKLVVIPINQKVLRYNPQHRNLEINEEKLLTILKQKEIVDTKHFIKINKNTTLMSREDNKLYCIVGGKFNENGLEIKSLFSDNNLANLKERIQIAISTISKQYDLVDVDVLGKIYQKRKIEL